MLGLNVNDNYTKVKDSIVNSASSAFHRTINILTPSCVSTTIDDNKLSLETEENMQIQDRIIRDFDFYFSKFYDLENPQDIVLDVMFKTYIVYLGIKALLCRCEPYISIEDKLKVNNWLRKEYAIGYFRDVPNNESKKITLEPRKY